MVSTETRELESELHDRYTHWENTLCNIGCYTPIDPWDYVGGAPAVRDALGVGVTWSGNLDLAVGSGSVTIGSEMVYHEEKNTLTGFWVFGVNGSLHYDDKASKDLFDVWLGDDPPVSTSIDIYVTPIFNVNNVVKDYAGNFVGKMSTRALKVGIKYGEATSVDEINTPPKDREAAYGKVYGLAGGYAWNEDVSGTHYVPVSTFDLNTGQTDFHLFDYIFGR